MNSSNSSNSSGVEGNTKPQPKKQDSPKKKWCFTLHNYSSEDIKMLQDYFDENCQDYLFAEEKGKSGNTPHLQGYVVWNTKRRFTEFKHIKKEIHWEPAKGNTQENIKYITKEGGNLYGSLIKDMVYNEPPAKQLQFMYDIMLDYQKLLPKGDRKIHVIVDEIGGLGKTEFARYCVLNLPRCIVTGGKAGDMKNQIVALKQLPWYIICDVPRHSVGYLSYGGLEEIKNMLFYSGKYEGNMICGNKPFMLLLMNEHPDYDKMSKDRWVIHEISSNF